MRRKTTPSRQSFLAAARWNPAAAVERDPAETQTHTHTGNKRRLIVVVDTGGGCWWREWELIKRFDTPRGTTSVCR